MNSRGAQTNLVFLVGLSKGADDDDEFEIASGFQPRVGARGCCDVVSGVGR